MMRETRWAEPLNHTSIKTKTMNEETMTYEAEEYAYSVLHATYPDAPLEMLTQAVSYDWVDGETDERNIESCSWLDNYQYYI